MSINEPNNELIHLYEIRDALKTRFGNEKAACEALGISNNKWKDLRKLACTKPLKQGRHRGLNQVLRDATVEELEKARSIARSPIEAYLEYLERQGQQ